MYRNSEEKMLAKSDYQYGIGNKVVETNSSGPDGVIDGKTIYKYDGNNLLTSENIWEPKPMNFSIKKLDYYYNEKNQLTKELYYDYSASSSSGNASSTVLYKYDDVGNKIERETFSKGILHSRTSYEYDQRGNLTEEDRYNSSGELDMRKKYRYDANNNVIEDEFQLGKTGSTVSEYKYVLDEFSNWTQKVTYLGNAPVALDERKITYY